MGETDFGEGLNLGSSSIGSGKKTQLNLLLNFLDQNIGLSLIGSVVTLLTFLTLLVSISCLNSRRKYASSTPSEMAQPFLD